APGSADGEGQGAGSEPLWSFNLPAISREMMWRPSASALVLPALLACSPPGPPCVDWRADGFPLLVGDTLQLVAGSLDEMDSDCTPPARRVLTWSSANPHIAS